MWGLIYKDFCVCKKNIVMSAISTLMVSILFVIVSNFLFDLISETDDNVYFAIILLQVTGYLCIFLSWIDIVNTFIAVDERTVWVNFVSSSVTPKVQIQSKYCEGIIIAILLCSWCILADSISVAIFPENSSLSSFAMVFMFTLIIVWSLEIPFTVAFGSKYGGYVKMAIFLLIFATVIIYTLYFDTDALFSKFEQLITSQDGTLMLTFNAIYPYVACILYWISYRVSCRLYLKGAEHCE
jgi:hypothetical protein